MAKFLIVGCGDIGSRVGNQLANKGHEVWGLKRNPPVKPDRVTSNSVKKSTDSIKYFQADISSREQIQQLDTNFDQLIYIITPNGRDAQAYREVFELGVNNLLHHFSTRDANKNMTSIFVSSSRVYGQQNGEWVDEETVTNPSSLQGRIILAAEQAFLEHHPQNTIVRFSGIYGRSAIPFFMRPNKMPPNEKGPFQFDPPYYTNRIHHFDCVGFLVYLAQLKCLNHSNTRSMAENKTNTKPTKLDSIYLVSDDDPAPLWEVVNSLWPDSQTTPPKEKTNPDAPQNKRCNNARMKSLGYELLIKTYREGYTG